MRSARRSRHGESRKEAFGDGGIGKGEEDEACHDRGKAHGRSQGGSGPYRQESREDRARGQGTRVRQVPHAGEGAHGEGGWIPDECPQDQRSETRTHEPEADLHRP